jgi:hypothetical protein
MPAGRHELGTGGPGSRPQGRSGRAVAVGRDRAGRRSGGRSPSSSCTLQRTVRLTPDRVSSADRPRQSPRPGSRSRGAGHGCVGLPRRWRLANCLPTALAHMSAMGQAGPATTPPSLFRGIVVVRGFECLLAAYRDTDVRRQSRKAARSAARYLSARAAAQSPVCQCCGSRRVTAGGVGPWTMIGLTDHQPSSEPLRVALRRWCKTELRSACSHPSALVLEAARRLARIIHEGAEGSGKKTQHRPVWGVV